jgi:hypothetical protein
MHRIKTIVFIIHYQFYKTPTNLPIKLSWKSTHKKEKKERKKKNSEYRRVPSNSLGRLLELLRRERNERLNLSNGTSHIRWTFRQRNVQRVKSLIELACSQGSTSRLISFICHSGIIPPIKAGRSPGILEVRNCCINLCHESLRRCWNNPNPIKNTPAAVLS